MTGLPVHVHLAETVDGVFSLPGTDS